MPSFNNPKVTNPINSDVSEIRELLKIVAKQDYTGATDLPEGAKRLAAVSGGVQLQKYANSSWSSIGKLMHDVDQLDGHHASTTAVKNTIPVYNNKAQLPGDITGNAATSTKLKTARTIDVGGIASATEQKFDGSGNITIPINSINVANDDDNALVGVVSKAHGGTGRTDGAATDVILSNGGKASEYGQIGEAKNINNVHLDTIINQGVYMGTTATFELGYPKESTVQYTIYVSRNGTNVRQTIFLRVTEVWCRTSSNTGSSWGRWECVSFSTADTGNRTIYISKSGNDSNVGLDQAHPVLTIDRALDIAKQVYNPKSGKTVIFCIGEGDWGGLTLNRIPYYLYITSYSGDTATEYSTTLPHFSTIIAQSSLLNIGSIVCDFLDSTANATIIITQKYNRIGSFRARHGGVIEIIGGSRDAPIDIISITNHDYVYNAYNFGHICHLSGRNVNIVENLTLSGGFLLSTTHSDISMNGATIKTQEGVTVTGVKYKVKKSASISGIDDLDSLPGTSRGVKDVGAIIDGIPYGGGAADEALMADLSWKPVLLRSGGTITGELIIKPENTRFGVVNALVTKGTNPSAAQYWQVQFADKSGLSSGNSRLGCIETKLNTDGTVQTEISAYQNKANSNDRSIFAVYRKLDGTGYATCPTPPSDAKSTEIATAAWVRGLTYKGATASAAGTAGLVPAAAKGEQAKVLRGDGTWGDYLPTTEGVVNGKINFNQYGTDDRIGEIVALNDEYGKRLVVDTYEEGDIGAFLSLRKGSDTINPGGFELCVRNIDDSVSKALTARTDGNLWWDNKQIVRSVNGALADATGNVTLDTSTSSVFTGVAMYARQTGIGGLYHDRYGNIRLPNYGTWRVIRFGPDGSTFISEVAGGSSVGSRYDDTVMAFRVA